LRAPTASISAGFQPRSTIPVSPGVGVYIDGVYLARNVAFDSALYDLERVEILKGPQGTLFGKNTIQGVVSVVTKDPSDEFEGVASAQLGNYNLWQARVSVSGPISGDRLTGSFTGYAASGTATSTTLFVTTMDGQNITVAAPS
jgi:outer membrane receptor protein involved in Fe transport